MSEQYDQEQREAVDAVERLLGLVLATGTKNDGILAAVDGLQQGIDIFRHTTYLFDTVQQLEAENERMRTRARQGHVQPRIIQGPPTQSELIIAGRVLGWLSDHSDHPAAKLGIKPTKMHQLAKNLLERSTLGVPYEVEEHTQSGIDGMQSGYVAPEDDDEDDCDDEGW